MGKRNQLNLMLRSRCDTIRANISDNGMFSILWMLSAKSWKNKKKWKLANLMSSFMIIMYDGGARDLSLEKI